jgi:hypothetical protein
MDAVGELVKQIRSDGQGQARLAGAGRLGSTTGHDATADADVPPQPPVAGRLKKSKR